MFLYPSFLPGESPDGLAVYSMSTVLEAFRYISLEAGIEFDFAQGGCQQRAQIVSMLLDKKFQLQHGKIWLFAPAALVENSFETFFYPDKNGLAYGSSIQWNYHLAPVLRVQTNTGIELRIFDPSIHRESPLDLESWFWRIGNSAAGTYTFSNPAAYFFNCRYDANNQLTNIFDGSFSFFENPAKDDLVMEKGLAVNDMAMHIFYTHIQPLMQKREPDNAVLLEDLQSLFGNATALDRIFCQGISGNTDNTLHRYWITRYPQIMQEAHRVFTERLLHWTSFSNKLL